MRRKIYCASNTLFRVRTFATSIAFSNPIFPKV